jgi:hypothetical protein
MVTEAGWDLGCCCACLLAAGLATTGVSLSGSILFALPALLIAAILLRRYFANDGAAKGMLA